MYENDFKWQSYRTLSGFSNNQQDAEVTNYMLPRKDNLSLLCFQPELESKYSQVIYLQVNPLSICKLIHPNVRIYLTTQQIITQISLKNICLIMFLIYLLSKS